MMPEMETYFQTCLSRALDSEDVQEQIKWLEKALEVDPKVRGPRQAGVVVLETRQELLGGLVGRVLRAHGVRGGAEHGEGDHNHGDAGHGALPGFGSKTERIGDRGRRGDQGPAAGVPSSATLSQARSRGAAAQ